jgi:hypothetical protein
MPARYQSKAELMPGAEKYMPGYGKGGSYGSASQSPLLQVAQAWQDAQDKNNADNNARYNDIIAGRQDMFNTAMGYLDKSGGSQRQDINDAFDKSASQVKLANVGRGMANSTVMDTMLQGNTIDRTKAMGRLEDQLNQQRLGYQTQLQSDLLQFMERKNEQGPDFNQLLQLASMMGQGGLGANQALPGAFNQGGGGGALGVGGVMGQPFSGDAQFAGMGGGFGGPNGFQPWGGQQQNFGGGQGGNFGGGQNLNPFQQKLMFENAMKQAAGELGQQWGPMPNADWFTGQWDQNGNPIGQMSNEQFDQSMNDAYFGTPKWGQNLGQFDNAPGPNWTDWGEGFGGGNNYDVPVYDGYYGTEQPVYGYDNGGGSGYYGTPDEYYY